VNRAIAVLTCGAFLTLVIEAGHVADPAAAIAIAAVFSILAIAGFGWVDRQSGRRRQAVAAGYVVVMLALGDVMFSAAGDGVGSTLLLMVLVSQSVRLLPLSAAALVIAIVPLVHVGMTWGDGLRNGFGTLVAAVFTAVFTGLLQREQRARAELGEANAQLRGFAAQAEDLATTQERNRLARDIHDGLGHHLTVVQMQIQAARAVLAADPARADEVLAKAQQQATDALVEVRHSVSVLREPREREPLPAALEALAAQTRAAGVPTELRIAGPVRQLPAEVEESLFRFAQEGLTNVRKHARASWAELILDFAGAGSVRLEVRDDGSGVDPAADPDAKAGFGILGLRERAARLSGSLDLESTPGQGTTLRMVVPG